MIENARRNTNRHKKKKTNAPLYLGNLRARDAHGDPDSRLLEGGCVVDPVSCHGGDLPTGTHANIQYE